MFFKIKGLFSCKYTSYQEYKEVLDHFDELLKKLSNFVYIEAK